MPGQADCFVEDGIESSHGDKHLVKAQEWKVLVPVATAWIVIAGKPIYKMCLCDQGASQNLYHKRIWNKPKWEHWKDQLRSSENRHDFEEECREYATRALAKVVEVEKTFQLSLTAYDCQSSSLIEADWRRCRVLQQTAMMRPGVTSIFLVSPASRLTLNILSNVNVAEWGAHV